MRSPTPSILLFIFSVPLLTPLLSAQSVPTTCYVIDGQANVNAGFRCNNSTTGHSSCCAIGATCWSNGLCEQLNGKTQDYLRVGCTDPTWQAPACLDQCRIYATISTAGIRFCDGALGVTTQYCCDNGTSGVGSFECCGTPSSIFTIAPPPSIIAQIPLNGVYSSSLSSTSSSSTSSSSTSSSTSSTTSASTTSPAAVSTSAPAATSTSASSNSKSDAVAIGVGAGVGIPVGLALIAGLGYFLWRRRKQDTSRPPYELGPNNAFAPAAGGGYHGQAASMQQSQQFPTYSADQTYGAPKKSEHGYYAPDRVPPTQPPAELPTSRPIHEM